MSKLKDVCFDLAQKVEMIGGVVPFNRRLRHQIRLQRKSFWMENTKLLLTHLFNVAPFFYDAEL